MKGIEKQVLDIISGLEEADKRSVGSKLAISTEYVDELCSFLVKDGYLEETRSGKVKLTPKGEDFAAPVVKTRKPFIKW